VPRLARPFVAVVVAVMIASAIFVWEPWPFTSFRLFSHLRHDEQAAWVATAVGPRGEEAPFQIDSLDHGFVNFGFRMAEFVDAETARRAELCRTWVQAADAVVGNGNATEVRLYRRTWRLSDRSGDRSLPGTRDLVYVCTESGARVVG
jgi:hypothetical protein